MPADKFGGGGPTVAKPVPGGNGKMGRYVYDKYYINWHAREQFKYTENLLSLKEIPDAFEEVRDGWNNLEEKPFEVVAFDDCIMSVYETALALENNANYMVASQESTFNKVGLNYTDLLNDLSKNPSMSGKELGKVICKTTWDDSKVTDKEFGLSSNSVFTESVIDLSATKMDVLKTAYANFNAEALRVAKENPDDIIYTFTKFKNAANVSDRFSIIGGGISIYYPLNFISNGEIVDDYKKNIKNYNSITEELNSESAAELYHYIFEGVNENLKIENVIDPKTNKPYRAWTIPEDSVFNLSELSYVDIKLNEDKKTATIEIDEDKQQGIERVRYQFFNIIPRNDDEEKANFLLLGGDSEVEENRQAGAFKISFNDKKWVTLDGTPLYIQVVSDSTRKNKNGKITKVITTDNLDTIRDLDD